MSSGSSSNLLLVSVTVPPTGIYISEAALTELDHTKCCARVQYGPNVWEFDVNNVVELFLGIIRDTDCRGIPFEFEAIHHSWCTLIRMGSSKQTLDSPETISVSYLIFEHERAKTPFYNHFLR